MINNLKASKNTITDLKLVQNGDSTLPPGRYIHLRHHTGNQAATGSQLGAGIRGKHHPGLNSDFFFNCSEMSFRMLDISSLGNRRRRVDSTSTAHLIFSCTVLAQTCFFLLSECTVHIDPMHLHGSSHTKHSVCVSHQKTHTSSSSRNIVHLAALDVTTHGHSFLTFLNQSSSEQNNPAKIDGHSRVAR